MPGGRFQGDLVLVRNKGRTHTTDIRGLLGSVETVFQVSDGDSRSEFTR